MVYGMRKQRCELVSALRLEEGIVFLQGNDRLLPQVHQHLPFIRHDPGVLDLFNWVENVVAEALVRPEEVVVGDPESDVVVCAVIVIEAAFDAIGGFEGAVESLDDLLERPEFSRNLVFVGEAKDLSHVKAHRFSVLEMELLCSQRVSAVAVSDEAESFRKLLTEGTECHPHGQDTGTDITALRDLIAEDRTFYGVHNEPDVRLPATDFGVSLITDQCVGMRIVVVIDERLDEDRSGPGIVGDLLMRDPDPIEIVQGLGGLSKRELQIDVKRETERHHMDAVLGETQGGSVLRQGIQIDLKEVDGELPVDVVEFVFGLAIGILQVSLVDLPKVVQIVGTLEIVAFVNSKMLSVFDGNQCTAAVRTSKDILLVKPVPIRGKTSTADGAAELTFGAVVLVEILHGSTAVRTAGISGNVAVAATFYRLDGFAVVFLEAFDERFPVPVIIEILETWKDIRLELLVFRRP